MTSQQFSSFLGTVHSSISGSSGEYLATSISLNFESDRVAVSTSNVSTYTGKVYIYDYGSSWTQSFSLTGPDGTNSSFGHEISLNWSGTRLAVSAYQKNKVYIYDATGTGSNPWASYVSNTLNTSSLSLSSTDEFGYSISLAQDDGNRIAVGAPGENKVYVYEYDNANSNWGNGPVWSSTDSGINNVLVKTLNADGSDNIYIHAHGVSNRYGHKVRLSAFGNYLIIGAPGTTDGTINNSTSYDPEGTTNPYTDTAHTGQHQVGHVRCFTNDTSTWASGTTQYGQDVRGKAGTVVGDDNQPGFGTSCDISTNGNKIIASSPYKKVSTLGNAGQVDTYLINDDGDTWLSVSTSLSGDKSAQSFGMNVRLDYAGERLATGDVSTVNQESAYYSGISLYAYDFGTDRWYDITRPLELHTWPTQGSTDFCPVDLTNGKIIAISDPRDPPNSGSNGRVVFYQFPLTNAIQGNTSVGGYVKCQNLFVGANDNYSNTDHTVENKRISFGGTIKDNSYEQTYIENRSIDGAGRSELLLYKRNDIWDKVGGNPHAGDAADDSIRIKSAEICLDFENTNAHGTYPNASERKTRFRMNRGGQVAIGESFYNNAVNILSPFDVNSRSYFWTMVNIGNNHNKPVTNVPAIDTNNERVFLGQSTTTDEIGGGKDDVAFKRHNVSSQAWDADEYAFYFSANDATIYMPYHAGNFHNTDLGFSVWIKLNDTPANCSGVLVWWGEDHHREEYNRLNFKYRGGELKLVSGGLSLEYEHNSANALTISYTFAQDTWYNIRGCVPAENTTPDAASSIWPKIEINGINQSIPSYSGFIYSGPVSWDDSSYGFGSALTYSRQDHPTTISISGGSWGSTTLVKHSSSTTSNVYYRKSGDTNNSNQIEYRVADNKIYAIGSNISGFRIWTDPYYSTVQSPLVTDYYGRTLEKGLEVHILDSSTNTLGKFSMYSLDINRDNSYYQNVANVSGSKSDGVKNCWLALFSIGNQNIPAFSDVLPGELLTVGGTATIEKYLGVRQMLPQYPVDVTGDINYTGELRKNGVIQSIDSTSGDTFANGLLSSAGTHPTNAMTNNSSGGFVASASSTNPVDWYPYKAFNQVIGGEGWHSSDAYSSSNATYSGSTSTTYDTSLSVSGEWIQLQFSSGVSINKIEIAPRTNYLNRCAGSGRILGSTNGSTWSSIATFSGKTYLNGTYTSITFTASSMYTYFRVVVTNLSGTGAQALNISEIRFTSVDVPDTNYVYYPSSGTTKRVGINTTYPTRYLDVAGTVSSSNGGILLRNGDSNTAAADAPQIAFGWNGTNTYQHFIRTRHNGGSATQNAIDFFVCDTTQNNYLGASGGITHNLTLEAGNVGIGTGSPTQAKLVINGHQSSSLSYGYLNIWGSTGQSSGTNSYSIYANERIAAAEFNAHSDSRIKKNVVDINDSSALDKIRLLEPKIYNYIDENRKGKSNVYGFIAQEVLNVLPYAVTVSEGDIPNILTNSNVSVTSDSNVLELRLDTPVTGLTLSNTSNINITTNNNDYITVPVLTFSGSNVITIQNNQNFSNVTGAYIHGEHVHDFHHLNKDAIWAVSTAALQEVDRQLQAEKTKVATLQTQVADLLTRVTALENN